MKCVLAFVLAVFLGGCSTTKCKTIENNGNIRKDTDPPPEVKVAPPTLTPTNAGTRTSEALSPTTSSESNNQSPATTGQESPTTGTVRVFKYDNSRQCGQGKGIALEEMAKQLKKIKILSQEKKNDGMMRIQMCGAPTGIANTYEIDQKDLKNAVKLGFREWKYGQQH